MCNTNSFGQQKKWDLLKEYILCIGLTRAQIHKIFCSNRNPHSGVDSRLDVSLSESTHQWVCQPMTNSNIYF